jgi:hypothetical protein
VEDKPMRAAVGLRRSRGLSAFAALRIDVTDPMRIPVLFGKVRCVPQSIDSKHSFRGIDASTRLSQNEE